MHDPYDDKLDLIVLPAMVNFLDVKFYSCKEAIDFMRQLLEVSTA